MTAPPPASGRPRVPYDHVPMVELHFLASREGEQRAQRVAEILERAGLQCSLRAGLGPDADYHHLMGVTVKGVDRPLDVYLLMAEPEAFALIQDAWFSADSGFSEDHDARTWRFIAGMDTCAFVATSDEALERVPRGLARLPRFNVARAQERQELLGFVRSIQGEKAQIAPPAPSSLPLSALSPFNLSPAARAILDRAKAMTPPGGRWATLSTLAFLFAFKELGRETPQNEDTVHFVHRYLDREAADEYQNLYETTVRTWIEDSPPDVGTDQPPGEWVTTITPNVLRLFERARDISSSTSAGVVLSTPNNPPQTVLPLVARAGIHARHLFAALLTFEPAPGTPNNILAKLTGLGLDLTALKTAFYEVVTANTPEDNSDAWRTALGLPPAERAAVPATPAPVAQAVSPAPSEGEESAGAAPTGGRTLSQVLAEHAWADGAGELIRHAFAIVATNSRSAITSTRALVASVWSTANGLTDGPDLSRVFALLQTDRAIQAVRHHYPRLDQVNDEIVATFCTAEFADILNDAQRITMSVTPGDAVIRPVHLIASILTYEPREPTNATKLLVEMGANVADLRGELYAAISPGLPSEEARAAWRQVLRIGARAYQVAFSADQNDTDKLNLEHEIDAFAYLIASTGMRPPLSIGLFGEWGSGKSFFMARLRERIAGLAEDARRDEAEIRSQNPPGPALDRALEGLRIHRHICQIEFNAWHYVEGNIWASLVEHIFSNLQAALIDPKAPELEKIRQQEELKKQLGFAQQARADLVARLDSLDAARKEAERKVDEAKKEHMDSSIALAKQLARDVWNDVAFSEKDNPGQLRNLLKQAGFPDSVLDTPKELYAAIRSIRTTGGWFRAQFAMLAESGRDGKWYRSRPLWIFAGAALAALAFAALLWLLQTGALAGVVAVVIQVGGAIVAVAQWLSRQAANMNRLQRAAEPVFNSLERKLAAAAEEKQRNVAVLEKDAQQLSAILVQARGQLDQLDQDISRLQAQIRAQDVEPDATKVLAQFIEERAACTDYRRHLGITAVIRRDFEKLASLISSRSRPAARAEASPSVDRIVLYIDDLDRCPPDKVVAVLEAIHLILAFELFVVVVGVDARWVSRSLRSKYGPLLSGRRRAPSPTPDAAAPPAAASTPAAVPEDYLEKIFHIPFRLRPLQPDDAARLIEHLAIPQPPRAASTADRPSPTRALVEVKAAELVKPIEPGRAAAPIPLGAAARAGEPQPAIAASPAPTPAGPGSPPIAGTPGPSGPSATPTPLQPGSASDARKPAAEVDVSILHLTKDETRFMTSLAPIVGRSPRAVFRFVNCYRIHKAARPPARIPEFEAATGGANVPPYEAAMLILGLVIGAPEIAGPMLSMLVARGDPQHAELHKLIADWDRDPLIGQSPDWKQRIAPFLREYDKAKGKPCPIAPFRDAASAVARYSFRTGMMEDLEPAAPRPAPRPGPPTGPSQDRAASKKA